ncbi:hypothetical protein DFH07DRAFT_835752 [Mycena maculata]|uniref:Uncharacterized protein n=1 Tax=Mycena maculata TaxID=230809 RepID=A0AAD7N2Y1_9AGAR|nr:hypothetical protein DFH07DRAFT_835752 [Mycena maculata]
MMDFWYNVFGRPDPKQAARGDRLREQLVPMAEHIQRMVDRDQKAVSDRPTAQSALMLKRAHEMHLEKQIANRLESHNLDEEALAALEKAAELEQQIDTIDMRFAPAVGCNICLGMSVPLLPPSTAPAKLGTTA